MSATVTEEPIQALSFPVQDFDIDGIRSDVLSLRINGIDDTAGQKKVRETRLRLVKMRTAIEAKRKDFKEVWLRGGKAVDEAAKKLQEKLAPLEQHCIAEESAVAKELERIEQEKSDAKFEARRLRWNEAGGDRTDRAYLMQFHDEAFDALILSVEAKTKQRLEFEEKQRIEAERLAKEKAEFKRLQEESAQKAMKIQSRLRLLAGFKRYPDERDVRDLSDESFMVVLADARSAYEHDQEEQRKAVERQRNIARRMNQLSLVRHYPDQNEVERMSDDQFQDHLNAATDVFNEAQENEAKERAERTRIAEENAERIRKEAIQKAADEAAEKAIRDTEARLKRETEEKEQQRLIEEARIAKEAALRPAKEKLNAFAIAVSAISQPQISVDVDRKVLTLVNNFVKAIGRIADELE